MARTTQVDQTGTVKRLVLDRGFGFIGTGPGGVEYFFHRSACENFDALYEGASVRFDITESVKGPRAEHVVMAT